MGRKIIQRMYAVSGKHHNNEYAIQPLPPTKISQIQIALQKLITEKNNPEKLTELLTENFLLDSFSHRHFDGFHSRHYYMNHAQPVLEVLFVDYPDIFFALFQKIKNIESLYQAFVKALVKTDLSILAREWNNTTLQIINENIAELDNHKTNLIFENAKKDAIVVSSLTSKLKEILQPSFADTRLTRSIDLKKRIQFAATLRTHHYHMTNHRKFWKVVAGNIMLAILGAGVFYGLAILWKTGKPYFFANTERQNKLENIYQATKISSLNN